MQTPRLALPAALVLALSLALWLIPPAIPSALAQSPADGLGNQITETGPAWTGQWTRRPGTTTWDATYSGGTGQPTTMTVTVSDTTLTAVRTSSADGNLCTYVGTIQADASSVTGQATCSQGNSFAFTLTVTDGLGAHLHEQGPSWTGEWIRRPGTTTWDATYNGGTGQPTVMTVTVTDTTLTAVRTSSGDGNLCTYVGTIPPGGGAITGQATCSQGNSFSFTLTPADGN